MSTPSTSTPDDTLVTTPTEPAAAANDAGADALVAALLAAETEPLTESEYGQVLHAFGRRLLQVRASAETAAWGLSRRLSVETLQAFGAVHLPPGVLLREDVDAVARELGAGIEIKVDIPALFRAGILQGRSLSPFVAPKRTGSKADLDTDFTDRRKDLKGWRFRHGGRVAYPLRDLEGKVRGYKSRAVHADLRTVGKYDATEADPPDAKYLHSKRPEGEKRAFQLLFSPQMIELLGAAIQAAKAKTSKSLRGTERRSVWITEGDVDCMLAEQAGAMSVGLGGCETHEGQILELMPALEEAAKQSLPVYLCLDTDPARFDRNKAMEMGAGQRGVCDFLKKIRAKSEKVARLIKVVVIPAGEGGAKQDLADVLAAEKTPEAQAAKLKELEGHAVGQVDFICGLLEGGKAEDRTANLKETGMWDLFGRDPDLALSRADEIGAALKLKPKEVDAWAKRTAKAAKKELEAAPPEITDDPLEEFTDDRGRREAVYECIRRIVEMINTSQTAENKLWWDEMALVPTYEGKEFTDHALGELRRRLAAEFKCHPKHASEIRVVVENISQCDRRHPVREYLQGLSWDGADRIPQLLAEVLGVVPESENQRRLYTAFLRRWMIAAVARAFATAENPEKADNVLVLAGKQDLRKSSFFEYLVPQSKWCDSPDISDFSDASAIKLAGLWIAEMAESNGSSYWKDLERQKAWLTKRKDRVVRKYVAYAETLPRGFVLGATVNEKQFLADSSGFRRQWCLWLSKVVDTSLLETIRDQLWAQAHAAWKTGEQHWLTEEEKVLHLEDGQQFQVADFERDKLESWLTEFKKREVTSLEICEALKIDKPTSGDSRRITRHLAALGWEEKKVNGKRIYRHPAGKLEVVGGEPEPPPPTPPATHISVAEAVAGILDL